MHFDRRSFVKLSSIFALGTALQPTELFAAAPRILKAPLAMADADEAVLDFLNSYASAVRMVGASVQGRFRDGRYPALHLLAEVNDLNEMTGALPVAPFNGVYADGNVLSFSVDGVDVVVENLLPEVFASRLNSLGSRKHVAFAHDGLVYNPANLQLDDPFNASRLNALKMVNKTFSGTSALEVALRGTIEAHLIGVREGEDFIQWKARTLRQIVKSGVASEIAQTFLQHVASLAEFVSRPRFKALLKSRWIRTALLEVFGINTAAVVAAFDSYRASLRNEVSDAAAWLALLLSSEIQTQDGLGVGSLYRGARGNSLRSRQALGRARELVGNSHS